jgi:hypothetical protein
MKNLRRGGMLYAEVRVGLGVSVESYSCNVGLRYREASRRHCVIYTQDSVATTPNGVL